MHQTYKSVNPFDVYNKLQYGRRRGRVVRELDLKSGGPWFKSSFLPLAGFVLGSPEFNSSAQLFK